VLIDGDKGGFYEIHPSKLWYHGRYRI
jgi:hypothetical protein